MVGSSVDIGFYPVMQAFYNFGMTFVAEDCTVRILVIPPILFYGAIIKRNPNE
jgi:hypothetical protein